MKGFIMKQGTFCYSNIQQGCTRWYLQGRGRVSQGFPSISETKVEKDGEGAQHSVCIRFQSRDTVVENKTKTNKKHELKLKSSPLCR